MVTASIGHAHTSSYKRVALERLLSLNTHECPAKLQGQACFLNASLKTRDASRRQQHGGRASRFATTPVELWRVCRLAVGQESTFDDVTRVPSLLGGIFFLYMSVATINKDDELSFA